MRAFGAAALPVVARLGFAAPPASLQYPLFGLGEVVLLPNETLPLRIFEPRYRLMVARCLGDLDGAAQFAADGAAFYGDADPCAFAIPCEDPEALGGAHGVLATIADVRRGAADGVAYTLVARGAARIAFAGPPVRERLAGRNGLPLLHANVTTVRDDDGSGAAPVKWRQIKRRLKWLFGRDAMLAVVAELDATAPSASRARARSPRVPEEKNSLGSRWRRCCR